MRQENDSAEQRNKSDRQLKHRTLPICVQVRRYKPNARARLKVRGPAGTNVTGVTSTHDREAIPSWRSDEMTASARPPPALGPFL